MKKFRKNACRESREFCPPEGFAAWCRIEELSDVCGYDAAAQFDRLREEALWTMSAEKILQLARSCATLQGAIYFARFAQAAAERNG